MVAVDPNPLVRRFVSDVDKLSHENFLLASALRVTQVTPDRANFAWAQLTESSLAEVSPQLNFLLVAVG
jgi:hypothetical protein